MKTGSLRARVPLVAALCLLGGVSAGNDARVLAWNLEASSQTGEWSRSGP
jgi:hypothetical protein